MSAAGRHHRPRKFFLLYLGRAGGAGDGIQPGGSRGDGVDIAQAALKLVPVERQLRTGGTEQLVGPAQRIKSGEMTLRADDAAVLSPGAARKAQAGAAARAPGAQGPSRVGERLGYDLSNLLKALSGKLRPKWLIKRMFDLRDHMAGRHTIVSNAYISARGVSGRFLPNLAVVEQGPPGAF
jgi:hypothetical protein